jgi:hypothetical protein
LTPQSDDEGNDGGSIGTNHENPTIIPVIWKRIYQLKIM